MKKIIAVFLALLLLSGLTACGKTSGTVDADGVRTYHVGIAVYQFDDRFMTLYREEIESYFKTLETDTEKYELTFADGKNDVATQEAQVDEFIRNKMDAIILNLVQPSSARPLLEKIVKADIPLVLINREPLGDTPESYDLIVNNAKVCYVGADARQSGQFQGEILMAQPNHGDWNGDGVISYVMIRGDAENVDSQYRSEYSVKALTDAGYTVECLADEAGDWSAAQGEAICGRALEAYGDKVEVVLCNNDDMALGAAAAISAKGRTVGGNISLLGVDGLEECQKMVEQGAMTGTVLNDHVGQARATVDVTAKLLHNEAVDSYYWVDYVKVAMY